MWEMEFTLSELKLCLDMITYCLCDWSDDDVTEDMIELQKTFISRIENINKFFNQTKH